MRVLLIILVFALSVAAQETPFVNQTFAAGTKAAREGNYEQAIEQYRATILRAESLRLSDALLARIHFNIGVCLYHLRQTDEAVAEYTEAIRLSKREYQKAFYALGMAQKDLGNWQVAETALRDALKIDRADGEAWFDLALVLLEKKDLPTAEKAFAASLKYKTVNAADAHNNLGVLAALKDDWTAAEKQFQTALTDNSVEAAGNLRICKFYRQQIDDKTDLLAKLEFSRTKKAGG